MLHVIWKLGSMLMGVKSHNSRHNGNIGNKFNRSSVYQLTACFCSVYIVSFFVSYFLAITCIMGFDRGLYQGIGSFFPCYSFQSLYKLCIKEWESYEWKLFKSLHFS